MKVLLIACPVMDYIDDRLRPIAMDAGRECPPYGIYLLSSILKQSSNDVIVADLVAAGSHDLQPYLSDIKDCSLIGIGATSLSWPTAVFLIQQIRNVRADVPIVLGGIHPSMFDKYILKTHVVQYIIRGEGELAFPALCEALDKRWDIRNIPNLTWVSQDKEVIRNPAGPLLSGERLASFPLPDYDVLPRGVYKCLSIESSRGCAFDCSFCSTSYRQTWRAIPADTFVDRLEAILPYLNRTTGNLVQIVDDEFSTNPRRGIEIARAIRKRGIKLNMVFNARATDLLTEGFVQNIAEYTYQFLVGAECGYDAGLRRCGKGTTCQILQDAAKELDAHGMAEKADFSFILGLPWESIEDVKQTVSFAMDLLSKHGIHPVLQWYCQIPGSRLWDEARRSQTLHESMYDEFGFFRNTYLTRSGITLSPQEIWEIWEILCQMRWVAGHLFPQRTAVRFGIPPPIVKYFPREAADNESSLSNLRELARPQSSRTKTAS
jgi:anaerobic magnesium-protoporphyrin IX monomethyl ester cyclase